MENNTNIEKTYELIEQFDFAELSEQAKSIVLSVMTESQYTEMRKTVDILKHELASDIDPEINIPKIKKVDSRIIRILNYPMKFYQVAASIAIIISMFFMFQHSDKTNLNQMMAKNDTLVFREIDSVYTIVYDTIEIIKENVMQLHTDFQIQNENDLNTNSNFATNCSNNLCPDEMEDIIALNSRNTIKNDSVTKELLFSLD